MKKSEDGKKPTRPSLKNKGKVIARRTIERSQVRQSFSHGRTRSVTVEMRRRVVSPAQVKDSPDTENTDSPDKELSLIHI